MRFKNLIKKCHQYRKNWNKVERFKWKLKNPNRKKENKIYNLDRVMKN